MCRLINVFAWRTSQKYVSFSMPHIFLIGVLTLSALNFTLLGCFFFFFVTNYVLKRSLYVQLKD